LTWTLVTPAELKSNLKGKTLRIQASLERSSTCDYHNLKNKTSRGNVMFGMGMQELLIILVIVLIIFGAGKLPEIGSALGKGIKNFKKTMNDNNEIANQPPKKDDDKK
jgi:sec-independent protein translocase protein TatA